MGQLFEIMGWSAGPLALTLAALHVVVRNRITLGLTAVLVFMSIGYCAHTVLEVGAEKSNRISAAVTAGANMHDLQNIEAEPTMSLRVRISFVLLGASIVPLFIGEIRRKRRERQAAIPPAPMVLTAIDGASPLPPATPATEAPPGLPGD